MLRRPPRSTLFPYTTSSDLAWVPSVSNTSKLTAPNRDRLARTPCPMRSEEHTSELQSLRHLVCRLLLEKKNTKRAKFPIQCTNEKYNTPPIRPQSRDVKYRK